jgi:hypothetical protein
MKAIKTTSQRLALAALLWAAALPALAQTQYGLVRWPGGEMYTEPSFSSATVGSVPRGEKVEFLQRDNIWWKVRWSGKEGWMNRILVEKLDAPGAAPVAAPAPVQASVPAPAQASQAPAPVAVAVAAPMPVPAAAPLPPAPVALPAAVALAPITADASAQTARLRPSSRGRAVVFGISQYQSGKGIPTLHGVPRDMDSAVAMAQLMGISEDRITIYRDAAITKESMTSTLIQLAKEVTEGEPVLVYYSGHGGRRPDTATPGRCIEGLITHDAQLLTSVEMSQLLQPLAKITDSLFVFFDSCHSGGLSSTRAVGGQQRFTPKFVARGDASNCSEIVNMLQSPPTGTRATGNRYVYAAASRANEISLDDAQNGGLATSNFLRCMVQGTGNAQSVEAIRACAQTGIEKSLAGNTLFKAHNMTITGDLNIRPVRSDLSPALKQQLLASAAMGQLSNRPAASKAAYISSELATQGWPNVFNPQQAFAAISDRTEAGGGLLVDTPATLKIDREALRMKVQAPSDGYIYVFQATGDGKNAVMLFPNTADRDNRLRAGQALDLPRPSWPLVAGGPEGDNQLLVVFSKTERDIGQLVGQEAGPFLDLAVSPTGMQALALAVSRSAHADETECKTGAATRPAYCSANFSASVKTIREVR